eukprot:65193-Rhodomonas_salina.1
MVAAAAAAGMAAAQAAQASAIASQQAIEFMRDQMESNRAEKDATKPGELDASPLAFPRWNLTRSSYAWQKKIDWVFEQDPVVRATHANYPPDPPAGLNAADFAAALQCSVDKRKQHQENVHALLVSTCSKNFFNVCNESNVNNPLCWAELWGKILALCNPDEESLVQFYQTMMKTQIASFNWEWEEWIKEIELIKTVLSDLGVPFADREFREHMYPAMEKLPFWKTWVEVQSETRPVLAFNDIRTKGAAKWIRDRARAKPEAANSVQQHGSSSHEQRNCKDANCPHDHPSLVWCSYHQKWTSHDHLACHLLKQDIALQHEARQQRGRGGCPKGGRGGRGGVRGGSRGKRGGARGGRYQNHRDPETGSKQKRRDDDSDEPDHTLTRQSNHIRAGKPAHAKKATIFTCSMAREEQARETTQHSRAFPNSGSVRQYALADS